MHYAGFDVALPTLSPKSYTSTTPEPNASGSNIASSPVKAIEAFDRLSDQEKAKVLGYIRTAHSLKVIQETEREVLQRMTMVAMLWLLIFTFCAYTAWVVSISSTR